MSKISKRPVDTTFGEADVQHGSDDRRYLAPAFTWRPTDRAALAAARRQDLVLVLIFSDARHGRVADRNGLVQGVLDELGLPDARQGDPSCWGITVIGIDSLAYSGGASLLYGSFGLDDPGPAFHSPIWQALSAVRAGQVSPIPRFWYFGGLATATRLAACLLAMPMRKSAS